MRFLFIISVLLSSLVLAAQTKMSSSTKRDLQFIEQIVNGEIVSQTFINHNLADFPIYKVNGVFCLSMIAKISDNAKFQLSDDRFFIGSQVGDIITVKLPLQFVSSNFSSNDLKYLEIATRIVPHNHKLTVDLRADSVWKGINLPKGFTGKNVLIGITDWGFDFTHPMFLDTNLTSSRIRAAWDHFKLSGPSPSGFLYGTEYKTPAALLAAQSDTAGTYYYYATHGSHVAGIAAGSGGGTKYRGVAFEAQYLFNSIQLDAGSAIDAFNWMNSIAIADGKRLVINMSWGLYYIGTLDGNSLLSQAIDLLSLQNIVFVTSAGNNDQSNFHLKKTFNNDSIRSQIQFYPYSAHPKMWGQCITIWGQSNNSFNSKIEVYNNVNQLVNETNFFSTQFNQGYFDSILVVGNDTVFYNFTIDSAHFLNGRPHMQIRVKNTNTSFKVVMNSYASTGTVHYWNVVELSNGVGNWGLEFIAFGNNGVAGDSEYGIGEPACTESVISVASHSSEVYNLQGLPIPGGHSSFSSVGPTYDGRMKPDVSAPGSSVVSSINSFTTASYTPTASIVFNGRTYKFAAFSGTSMSSPAAAGVVALILEANPQLSSFQVKDILKSTARQDNRTGAIIPPGSATWGMGKVTATDAIMLALNTTTVGSDFQKIAFSVFPNPSSNFLNVVFDSPSEFYYEIFNLNGQILLSNLSDSYSPIDITSLQSGFYILKVSRSGISGFVRFIKF